MLGLTCHDGQGGATAVCSLIQDLSCSADAQQQPRRAANVGLGDVQGALRGRQQLRRRCQQPAEGREALRRLACRSTGGMRQRQSTVSPCLSLQNPLRLPINRYLPIVPTRPFWARFKISFILMDMGTLSRAGAEHGMCSGGNKGVPCSLEGTPLRSRRACAANASVRRPRTRNSNGRYSAVASPRAIASSSQVQSTCQGSKSAINIHR